jgi:hypothetical protein
MRAKTGALTSRQQSIRLDLMSLKRTCANCAQTFIVPAGDKPVACPWCGAAVPPTSPAVTARPPAARPAAPTTNGRPTSPTSLEDEEPRRSTGPLWIILIVVGGFALLGLGVLAIVILGAFVLFRSSPPPAPPVAASDTAIMTQADAAEAADNQPNPDPDVDKDLKPMGPLPGDAPPGGPAPGPPSAKPLKGQPALMWRVGEARQRMMIDGGGNALSQAAVDKGLDWLAAQQRRDGTWAGDGTDKNPAAGTALALLPLLGAGHGAKGANSKHEVAVTKGLDALVRLQRPNGQLGVMLYHHGLAALALCEATALTDDARIRAGAQKAIDFIARSQHEGGGWGNQPRQPGETFVTGWQVQALHAAQLAGLKVPPAATAGANRFLDSVSSDRGTAYGSMSRAPGSLTSASGLYSRLLLGWSPRQPEVIGGIERLKLDTLAPKAGSWDSNFCLFASHLVFQVGGPPWEEWNAKVRDFLISAQLPSGEWPKDNSQIAGTGGKLASTSFALLTLEVYYRYPRPKPLIGD